MAEIASFAKGRFDYHLGEPEAVDQVMGMHQADCGTTVGKGKDTEVPAGSPLSIDRQLRAFIGPVGEFSAWTGELGDIDFRWPLICDPPMPGERQRRTLDAPCQQPAAEIVVKPPQPIEVDCVLIYPDTLDDYVEAGGAMRRKQGFVHQCDPIIRPHLTIG